MQQVVSFTRQRNLPPKNREEEVSEHLSHDISILRMKADETANSDTCTAALQEKHLQQLAEMQAASQEAGESPSSTINSLSR